MHINPSKLIIAVTIAVLIIGGMFIAVHGAKPGDALYVVKAYFSGEVSYVADIDDAVVSLETELASLDAQVNKGTLTKEQAVKAQAKIIAHLDAINSGIGASQNATLTPQQRVQLSTALHKLSGILITYRDSLMKIEELAGPAEGLTLQDGHTGTSQTVTELVEDTVQNFEDSFEGISPDETPASEVGATTSDSEGDMSTSSDENHTSADMETLNPDAEVKSDIKTEDTATITDDGTSSVDEGENLYVN